MMAPRKRLRHNGVFRKNALLQYADDALIGADVAPSLTAIVTGHAGIIWLDNHPVSNSQMGDAFAEHIDYPVPLMSNDFGVDEVWPMPGKQMNIRAADANRLHFDADFALPGNRNRDGGHVYFAGCSQHGGLHLFR
jgi:hypothetical protein